MALAGASAGTLQSASMLWGQSGPANRLDVTKAAELQKLRKAAGEFESMLLESLWKSMKQTFSDPSDPDSDPTLENFDDLSIQAMASAVGSSGGLGIKDMILKYLEPTIGAGTPGGTKAG
jgi:Rod binding domain-containing protein